jgi:LPS-assembly lipoprotein
MRELNFTRRGLLLASALVLAGCGYRPLYGKTESNASVAAQLSDISVAEQDQRAGQLVRNELISTMGGGGSRYLLKLEVTEKDQTISSVSKTTVDRHRYRLSAAYRLIDTNSGEEMSSGKSFSSVSYDTVEEPVADLQAGENARERAARELAHDLKIRLSAFFATRSS